MHGCDARKDTQSLGRHWVTRHGPCAKLHFCATHPEKGAPWAAGRAPGARDTSQDVCEDLVAYTGASPPDRLRAQGLDRTSRLSTASDPRGRRSLCWPGRPSSRAQQRQAARFSPPPVRPSVCKHKLTFKLKTSRNTPVQ